MKFLKALGTLCMMICAAVSFCLTLVFVLGVLLLLAFYVFCSDTPCEYDTYDKAFWREATLSNAYVFPEKDEINGEIIDFHYKSFLASSEPEIYLEVVYTEENFNAEIERLENISYVDREGKNHTITKDESYLFNYTTYIAVYNSSYTYEYACVDPTNYRIVYICIRYRYVEEITFDHKYLPKTYYYSKDMDLDSENPDPYHFYLYGSTKEDNMPY